MSKPTVGIFPIENGKLVNVLDANGFQIQNLDTSNLILSGGGGIDTGTSTAILKGDGNHGVTGAVADTDYASVGSVALKEDITAHDADVLALQTDITDLQTGLALKADSTDVTASLALKADDADLQAYITSNDAEVALKAYTTDVDTALATKADSSDLTAGLATKEDLLPTTSNDSYILARHNAGAGGAWFFVDPLTLGTTSQTFSDGVENSTTTFTSASANFVANDVGKAITGTNIPSGTTISSRTNSTTVILSAAATATASGITFTIVNRVEIGGTGTVTSIGVNNNATSLFATNVANPTSAAVITITPSSSVAANSFYGNGTNFAGSASFMSASTARTALGGTVVGQAIFQITSVNAISYPRINADNTATARTAAQTLTDLGAESALTFSAPLARSGNVISIPQSTTLVNGYLSSADFAAFNAKVPSTRTITTTAPLTGGGDLSVNRTFAMPAATDSVDGYLSATDHTAFVAKPPNTRTISTTAPLTGGGDLSANRTFSMPAASTSQDGYLSAATYNLLAAGAGVQGTTVTIPNVAVYSILTLVPPVIRLVFNVPITQTMLISLPAAASYGASLNYPFIEFVDIVAGGALSDPNGSVTLAAGAGNTIDGVTLFLFPKGMSYLRLNSNGLASSQGRWTTTKYFVDSFRDPIDATKRAQVDVSGVTTGFTRSFKIPDANFTGVIPNTGDALAGTFVYDYDANGNALRAAPQVSGPAVGSFVNLFDGPTVTWTVDSSFTKQKAKLLLGGNRTLAIANATNGMEFELVVTQPSSGGPYGLTIPSNSKTPNDGLGAVTLSTGASAVDKLKFIYDGSDFLYDVPHLNLTKSVAASCNVAADTGATTGAAGSIGQGNTTTTNKKYLGSAAFVAGSTYNACKAQLFLAKAGNPTYTLSVQIYTDSAGLPGAAIGTPGTIASSSLSTTLSDVDVTNGFGASLTSGSSYHVVIWGSDQTVFNDIDYVLWGMRSTTGKNVYRSANGSSWSSTSTNNQTRFTLFHS